MPLDSTQTPVTIPDAFAPLAWQTQPNGSPLRYKCCPGGRGSGKTESFARVLVLEAFHNKHLILCTRQFQNSIADSVHRVIQEQIYQMGLGLFFTVTEKTIHCPKTGSEFIYKGLERNINEIRSMFGITRCWIEEANNTRKTDFAILDPTIRETGAQIWISYNPEKEDDALHKQFVIEKPPPNSWVKHTTFRDNPWFPPDLERLRSYTLENDPDEYDWIWEGNLRRNADAMIFKNKIHLESIEEVPHKTRFFFGLDFGHSVSPTCLIRCWIKPNDSGYGEDLVIDREAYAYGIELDEMAQFFDNSIEDVRKWPIRADNARPETISYLSRQGFQVSAAEKWSGCEIDGIEHLRAFRKIIIHPTRCPHVARDFRLYSYKTDIRTREVLPIIVDKDDHGPDSARYALSDMIQMRGGLGVWLRLTKPNR